MSAYLEVREHQIVGVVVMTVEHKMLILSIQCDSVGVEAIPSSCCGSCV